MSDAIGLQYGRIAASQPFQAVLVALRGVGQIMFQGHAGTGALFLLGIAIGSIEMAAGALVGAVIGPLVARASRFNKQEITDGIYGFNATLVGIGTLFHLKPAVLTCALLAAGCVLSVYVTYAMRRWLPFPSYTAPFVLSTWVVLWVASTVAGPSLHVEEHPLQETSTSLIIEILRGEAEVMFGANMVTGALFLVGIALSNWRHAVVATLGSTVGTVLAQYHGDPESSVAIGIYGYNAALAAMAAYLWRRSLWLAVLGAILSVPLTEYFPTQLGIPALTAPFVLAAWALLLGGVLENWFERQPAPS